MSYGTVRKKLAEQREQAPEINQHRCSAIGCPCRGTCSSDGYKFVCSAHDAAQPEVWPRVTESLNEHKWLIELIDDLKAMRTRNEDWRSFAVQFWTEDESLRPDPKEGFEPYEIRMRGELLHRCGLAKRPALRLPRESKPGNLGRLLWRRSEAA